MATDTTVTLCGLTLPGPLVLASGIWGSSADTMARVARAGAGAVTSKSCSLEPRAGHPNPTVLDWGGGIINAVGLSNPGAAAEAEVLRAARRGMASTGAALIASVFGNTLAGFVESTRRVAAAQPDAIEINISCPNVESEFGRPFALDRVAAAEVTAAVRAAYEGPLLVKLSPNAPDLADVAAAVADAGADGITAVNTLGPGMVIDIHAGCPVLTNRVGGVSGMALRPIALRCVYDIARAVDLPIIGTGGVRSGRDAMAMIMVGATAVGVGSALQAEGPEVFPRIHHELRALMRQEGYERLADFRGCAHER